MLDENSENTPTEEAENKETSEKQLKKEVTTGVIAETTVKDTPEAIIEENKNSVETTDEIVPAVDGKESAMAKDENTPTEEVENIETPENLPKKEITVMLLLKQLKKIHPKQQ